MKAKHPHPNRSRWPYIWGCSLALAHTVFYFVVMSRNFEGSWGGFLIFMVDFPGSIPLVLLMNVLHITTPYSLLVGGCAWWFFLGMMGSKLFIWIADKTSLSKNKKHPEQPLAG